MLVIQRLQTMVSDGKITREQVVAVSDYFDAAVDDGLSLLTTDAMLAELRPLVLRQERRAGIDDAISEFKKNGNVTEALRRVERADTFGKQTGADSLKLGEATLDEIRKLRTLSVMSTRIPEVDDVLRGGYRAGTLTTFLGSSGGGKSMALIAQACAAALQGHLTVYATLELPRSIITARLMAHLTGSLIDDVLMSPDTCDAGPRLAAIQRWSGFGGIYVAQFDEQVTKVRDLQKWVKDIEEKEGVPVTAVVVDYGDKLGLDVRTKEDASSYTGQGKVWGLLYNWMRNDGIWGFTASAATRGKARGKEYMLDQDDTADSMHKVRSSDYFITVNMRSDNHEVEWFLAKNRLGEARLRVGPLPTFFEQARISPMVMPDIPGFDVR